MTPDTLAHRRATRAMSAVTRSLTLAALLAAAPAVVRAQGGSSDPRVGLKAGWMDAGSAERNMHLVAHEPRPDGFYDPSNPGNFAFVNSDLAFTDKYVFQGNYHGFEVWDISNPDAPKLRLGFVCPGGQGDVSVYKNLLFVSVEQTSGRVDCGGQGVADTVSAERFRGVRIFDISDIDHPRQVAAVQTCRGSHTHTLLVDPNDKANVYIYVSGTSPVRPGAELAGCSGGLPDKNPNTALFRIDVIRVPLAAPQKARVVSNPRIFADSGKIAGLWMGGAHGEGTQTTSQTNQCHDITVYSAIGLAAGACSGNGILLDIHDPVHPKRVAQVTDPNFAYWHSATFSNDGSKVIFTDERGGGVAPRCRATDRPQWGADAIFTRKGHTLTEAGYFKLPAVQTDLENCVAHNGSLVPVPGRDIEVQAWYQGGVSVYDFTDPAHPQELAFFDRGPMDANKLVLGGYWSAYWYNGHIWGSEIGRGLDVFTLQPSQYLTANEIEAAESVHQDVFNPQNQQMITWPPTFALANAYLDQLARDNGLSSERIDAIRNALNDAEMQVGARRRAALGKLAGEVGGDVAKSSDAERVRWLQSAIKGLASAR